jgi:hypothetical protein
MQKTHLELSSEIVTAMINKGYLRVAIDKGKDWKQYNRESVHTVGWAILEMYRELQGVRERAREEEPKRPEVKKIVVAR